MSGSILKSLALVGASSLVLAACAVGPKPPVADLPVAGQGAFVGSSNGAITADAPRDDWWRLYDDPVLDGLVSQALAENNDLQAAQANLRRVQAALGSTRSAGVPSVTSSASVDYGRSSAAVIPDGAPATTPFDNGETYDIGLNASYEIDLFGRIGAAIRAAEADAGAAAAALEIVQVTVAAETARAYADVCSANAQIGVAERTIELQASSADLTQRRLEAGAGNGLDTSRAQAALESSRAVLPSLKAQRDGALFRLATLTGRTPSEASQAARDCSTPPKLDRLIPVGDGAQLLARRPDVRQAERQLAAAAARVNVAYADLYPRISLGATVGSTALSAGGLGDDTAFRFGVGPLISWTIPNPGGARSHLREASAATDAALATFDQAVLVALQETETALANYANELDRNASLKGARDQAARAANLSRLRFEAGSDSFLTVLDAERTLASSDAALAQSDALVTTYQIALFKALAGGWSEDQPAS